MRSPVPARIVSPSLVAGFSGQTTAWGRPGPPLMIEIGCGNGHFLEEYADLYPGTDCLGIDLRIKRIEKSCRKADRKGLSNLRFMLGDAFAILAGMPPGVLADRIAVNFPDPWPKYRHRDNRLNRREAIAAMLARISPGGDFVWVCDYYPQIVDVLVQMQPWLATGEFENVHGWEGYGEGIEGYPRTLYEKRWRAMGRRIYYLRFVRRQDFLSGEQSPARASAIPDLAGGGSGCGGGASVSAAGQDAPDLP